MLPSDSKRHPLNSADASVVRNAKRYTLTRRVATARTLITIPAILRHGKLKSSDYSRACSDEQRDQEMCSYTNSDIASTIQISHFSTSRGRRIPDAAMRVLPVLTYWPEKKCAYLYSDYQPIWKFQSVDRTAPASVPSQRFRTAKSPPSTFPK